jgi:hypothetical protein
MLFVRMLIIILQRMSRCIQPKEACLPVITAASPVTSDQNVDSSRVEGLEEAANKSYIRHYTSDGSLRATRESCRSPMATMAMKGC